jgi:hypothetical protein
VTSKEKEDNGTSKRMNWIALCAELAVEGAIDLLEG